MQSTCIRPTPTFSKHLQVPVNLQVATHLYITVQHTYQSITIISISEYT